MMSTGRRVVLIFALFMASGFGGLIYESLWTHYLQLFLGHAAYAQTLVLMVFIGGLALGAWLCARFAQRLQNPLRWYAAVELAVGALALAFHPVFVAVTDWGYASLLPATCAAEQSVCATQWLVSALMLAPQSVLIGATFPLVSSAVLRLDPTAPGRHISMLYFLNSLGAVFGVLASIFVLIPTFGLPGTLGFAGAVNIALAAGAYALAKVTPPAFAVPVMSQPVEPTPGLERRLLPLLLVTALVTGLSSFIYEIVWIRMLSLVLGASTYSFELMLASFILGLALGGLWIRRRIDRIDDPVRYLGVVQVVMGVAAAATLPLYNRSFDFMAWLLSAVSRNDSGFLIFNLGSMGIALLVMLPATFCAGMTLPLITYRLVRSAAGERAIGMVYSVNTLGSILGVILAVHVLMVTLGLRGALLVGAAIDVGLGVMLIGVRGRIAAAGSRASWAAAAGVVVLLIVAIAFPIDQRRAASGVFRAGRATIPPGAVLRYHHDGKTATVDVIDQGGLRAISTNGKTDALIAMGPGGEASPDELTMAMLALMPLSYNPQAADAALIGFGSGMSTDVMLRSPNIRRVDTIEIEPAMVEGARLFESRVKGAYDDPRSHVLIDDAKSYFARGRHKYDIIVSEPSNPWVSGVASLFTEEFYARLATALNDGGVLSQWLHTYEMDAAGLASVFAAVAKTFPQFVVYSSNDGDLILIARKGAQVGQMDPAVLAWPAMRPIVERLHIADPAVLHHHAAGSAQTVLALFRAMRVDPNSDYRPFLEQRTSRTRFTQERVTELNDLQLTGLPLVEMFDGTFRPYDRKTESIQMAPPDRAAADAWIYHGLLTNAAFAPPGPPPAPYSPEHAARLAGIWATACHGELSFGRLLPSIATMAEAINTNIGKEAALEVWTRLERAPCASHLAPGDRRWLDLFAAVAARDPVAMSRIGNEVLEANRGRRDALTEYAFAATAAGLVCQHRFEEANKLFAAGTKDWLAESGSVPVGLRYLYELANLTDPSSQWPPGGSCGAPASS
jgi:spermidine synthase